MRIGDLERAAATDRLAAHAAAGRLSTEELETRVDAIHQATTAGDLLDVERDLPGRQPGHPSGRATLTRVVAILAAISVMAAIAVATVWHGRPGPPPLLLLAIVVLIAIRRGRPGRHWATRWDRGRRPHRGGVTGGVAGPAGGGVSGGVTGGVSGAATGGVSGS